MYRTKVHIALICELKLDNVIWTGYQCQFETKSIYLSLVKIRK